MTSAPFEPVLEVRNLTKRFKNRVAVDSLSFIVPRGEIFGFLGPNGAGKSTSIRMMLALIKPEKGDVLLFGKSVKQIKNRALEHVGALIEKPDFYGNLSARKNLEILARMENIPLTRVDEVLKNVKLINRAEDKVKAFSHGMKQRLGIGQALLNQPELLILDEPTNGLDPQGMKEVRDLIRELSNSGMTIFLSSHLLDEVQKVCTSMGIIHHGKLIQQGKVMDLLNESSQLSVELSAVPIDKAMQVLAESPDVKDINREKELILFRTSKETLPEINKKLINKGINVSALVPKTSLEEYFLSITGESDI